MYNKSNLRKNARRNNALMNSLIAAFIMLLVTAWVLINNRILTNNGILFGLHVDIICVNAITAYIIFILIKFVNIRIAYEVSIDMILNYKPLERYTFAGKINYDDLVRQFNYANQIIENYNWEKYHDNYYDELNVYVVNSKDDNDFGMYGTPKNLAKYNPNCTDTKIENIFYDIFSFNSGIPIIDNKLYYLDFKDYIKFINFIESNHFKFD